MQNTLRGGALVVPRTDRLLVFDPSSDTQVRTLEKHVHFPALVLDAGPKIAYSAAKFAYAYQRLLLASGEVILLRPSVVRKDLVEVMSDE